MLAVVWAVEHYHLYLYGAQFTIYTDHKPLLGIFNSQKPASARIERWRLRLMPYNYRLVYKPGRNENNPADYISRHPVLKAPKFSAAEHYVNYVSENAVPKAMTLEEIRVETAVDPVLVKLQNALRSGNWSDGDVKPYKKLRDEFSVKNGIVLRGTRIVIPMKLQEKVVNLAHIGHQGIVRTKSLLREKVWFTGIDKMVENHIQRCIPCQATTRVSSRPEPLVMSQLPAEPWSHVSVDFNGPLPSNEMLLVVTDDYSRFPEVEIVSSTAARTVLPKLDNIFSRQGIPEVVRSDNGPPFQGVEFKNFANDLGFEHRKVTPLWPQANGEVERFMDTMLKVIRTAHIERKCWKQELYRFLRQYRATPHATTGVAPAEALYKRRFRVQLPQLPASEAAPLPDLQKSVKENDARNKTRMKECADKRRNAKPCEITQGDKVLVKIAKRPNKLSPHYQPEPMTVSHRKGNMVTATRDGHSITRNVTFFKRLPKDIPHESAEDDDDTLVEETPEIRQPELPIRPCLKTNNNEPPRIRKPPVRFRYDALGKPAN